MVWFTHNLNAMLTDFHLQSFLRDGYVIAEALLPSTRVEEINANLSRLALTADSDNVGKGWVLDLELGSDPTMPRELRVRKYRDLGLGDDYFWALAKDSEVIGCVATLIGNEPQLLQTMALVKSPEIGSAKDWHQDVPYFPIAPARDVVGVWIALDDATLDNGCMQVVPASHLLGPVAHVQGPTGWRLDPGICERLQPSVIPLPMRAGSALFFDGALFHFTAANRSRQRRRALQNHYVPASTRIAEGRTGMLFPISSEHPPLAVTSS